MDTLRFWIYWNGLVKISLRQNQIIHLHKSTPTDEGYSYCSMQFERLGNMIKQSVADGGRDCDGRVDRFSEFECNVSELSSKFSEENQIYLPDWKIIDQSQRDYAAEAMRY